MNDRVVLAHGFTQTARSWATVEEQLHAALPSIETVAVDLPGHGDASHVRADLWSAADRLVDVGGAATYVGYSMGGRVALHAALAHPERVERLVLIGATAGLDEAADRASRRAADERLAARVDDIGVERFIEEWLANPLFDGLDDASAMRDDRLRNTVAGLASSLRSSGTGTQEPLWNRLGEIGCPTLLLVGEHDPKFRALGERMADGLPDARLVVVENAGHSVHLENPDATVAAIVAFVR